MQFPWKRARIQMEEDDYDDGDGDGSYGEEEDDEKAGLLKWVLIESVTCQKKFFAISFPSYQQNLQAVIDISDNGKRGDVSNIGLKPLTGTYNAKFLSLSGRSMKVFCGVNTSGLHVFSNLTQLKFGCNEYCGQLLPKLLEKSPNLEVLILGKDNAKLNTRDLVKIHMEATAVHS
ncbi:F-box/LRR-repeat protein [Gossypium australe]|uniref:F-box/LRR-repeat protein n=1 Tax=Gossypium australe TaxID=47621 RepID=A0A5B6VTY9_9ROSI|nr:F-box/LRR-repeat protein [Gossypium australe]